MEILCARAGGGSFALVVPALAALSREGRWVFLINPPYLPYAPGLAWQGVVVARLVVLSLTQHTEAAWAAEQGLRSGACRAVLAWGGEWQTAALRRLQLVAESGGALAWLFRNEGAAQGASPVLLRLQVALHPAGVRVRVLKQRGGWPAQPFQIWPWAQAECPPRSSPIATGASG